MAPQACDAKGCEEPWVVTFTAPPVGSLKLIARGVVLNLCAKHAQLALGGEDVPVSASEADLILRAWTTASRREF